MMSIKIVEESGEEFVHATSGVNYVPARAKPETDAKSSLFFYDSEGRTYETFGPIVFLMNDQGRTVARYDLRHDAPYSPEPKPPAHPVKEA